MDAHVKPAPNEIRLARSQNPARRERDLATQLGVSEAELVDGTDRRAQGTCHATAARALA